jgi:hypothetical protein
MANDMKVDAATQVKPTPIVLGTTATTALPGNAGTYYTSIGNASTSANGTQWVRTGWSCTVTYIGDTRSGGFGILCGTIQCNVNETLADGTTINTIFGFVPYQTASLRMNGHGTNGSDDMWYGSSGNNTRMLNNSGANRTYSQWSSNTFAIPVQKKY